jgi:hypothetical protein
MQIVCAQPPASGDDDARAACDHYFAAQYMTPCAIPTRPDAEIERMKVRFSAACLSQIAAPGSGMTPSAIEACASALEACQLQEPPLACDFHGSLPGGAPCNENMQCQSGMCLGTDTPAGPGGPADLPLRCGTCAEPRDEGQSCGDDGYCRAGFECMTTMTSAPNPSYTCTRVSEGDAGASCDELTALCKPGLYCADSRCAPLQQNQGDACGSFQRETGCQPPLSCGADLTCAPPAGEGESCADSLCAAGLACDAVSPQLCRAVTWVEPGAACDFQRYCRIGDCPLLHSPLGRQNCPMISADGESCVGNFDCDVFSDCLDGVCAPRDSVQCR